MQCTLAEKLIPLFVSNDLPDNEMSAVSAHRDKCAACRQLAAEFSENQIWLQGFAAPAVSNVTLENLRDAIHREIGREIARAERQPSRIERFLPRWHPQLALAASVAAMLLLAGIGIYRWRQQPAQQSPIVAKGSDTQSRSTNPNKPVRYGERERPVPRQGARIGKPRSLTLPVPQPPPVAPEPALLATNNTTASQEMLRIEMQTADPNIRIIWFAPKTDASTQPNTK